MSPPRAEPAPQDSGSPETGLGQADPGNPLAPAVQGAPCGRFPELLQ